MMAGLLPVRGLGGKSAQGDACYADEEGEEEALAE
jgi:hypothetical protein